MAREPFSSTKEISSSPAALSHRRSQSRKMQACRSRQTTRTRRRYHPRRRGERQAGRACTGDSGDFINGDSGIDLILIADKQVDHYDVGPGESEVATFISKDIVADG